MIKWEIIVVVILAVMFLGNKKVRVYPILLEQIRVFKNAKTKKISPWDIVCFLIFPILLACIITLKMQLNIDEKLAEVFTTVFSLIFTILFGFAAILVGKMDSKSEIERQVVGETFISIVSATLLSLLSAALSVVLLKATDPRTVQILSVCVYSLSLIIVMLLLLITKRTFVIYNKSMSATTSADGLHIGRNHH